MKKYRFTFFLREIKKRNIHNINKVNPERYTLKDDILPGYLFNYEIPERTITGSFKKNSYRHSIFGTGCGPTFHKEVKVDWRDTIYNMKVEKVRKKPGLYYKVSFSVQLTPKEAFIIGKELEDRYYQVFYKCL